MTYSPITKRYDVGIDSYRAAKILIDRHGEDARRRAEYRLRDVVANGDEAGAAVWRGISHAIDELQRGVEPGEPRH